MGMLSGRWTRVIVLGQIKYVVLFIRAYYFDAVIDHHINILRCSRKLWLGQCLIHVGKMRSCLIPSGQVIKPIEECVIDKRKQVCDYNSSLYRYIQKRGGSEKKIHARSVARPW
jgi:hypothetical protein